MKELIERFGAACGELLDWIFDHLGAAFILLLMAILAIGAVVLVWAMIVSFNSPHFSLKKSDWRCTQSHIEHTPPTYVKSGDIMVPVGGGPSTVCDQWSRQ